MRHSLTLAAAAALAAPGAARALPPPVPVAPVVVTADRATAEALRALVADMTRQGHFDAALAVPPGRDSCADVGETMRATCYASAARFAGIADRVYLHVAPGGEGSALRLHCIGPDQDRAQRAELDLAAALASDPAVARPQRQALASCLIGALHAPPRPVPPATSAAAEAPPPPIPPLPNGHFDRPPPLGSIRMGTLEPCDRALPDGRRYDEESHGLQPGQRIGLNLAAHGFAATLHVYRSGEPERPLAVLEAPAGGAVAGLVFTAPDHADYRFRVIGAEPGARGRWRLEIDYGGRIGLAAPDPAYWAANACAAG